MALGGAVAELLQPVLEGQALLSEIDGTSFAGAGAAVWWLGQSGFVVKAAEGTLYIDPYLSESLTRKYAGSSKPHVRMTRAPLRGRDVRHASALLLTHRHSDHMDPETVPDLMRASPQARCVVPRAHLEHVAGWGLGESRLMAADVGTALRVGGVVVHPVPAAHEDLAFSEQVGYPCMGYVFTAGGLTFYHSGDTVPYPGWLEHLRPYRIDVAFLPINGRDAERHALGTPGNCTIEEALCVARLADMGVVVPHHYDMFTFNTASVERFRAWAQVAFPQQAIRVMRCGEKQVFVL
jgi:L-ascorbate 6-phosphate lactonase